MKRVWGHVLAGVTFVAAGFASVAACKHDDSTLFVQDVLAAQPVTQGETCTFTNDPSQPAISSGVLDIGILDEYTPTFLLGNQAVAEVNSQQLQTETDIITVQGAVVIIDDANDHQLNTFKRYATTTVYPSTGSTPGYAPISVTIVDQNTLANDSDLQTNVAQGGITRLVTYVTFFGVTTGGNSVQSGQFVFPVDVCYGCLVSFAGSINTDKGFPVPNCLLSTGSTSTQIPCVVGQDTAVPCSACSTFSAACRGNVPLNFVPDSGTD